MQETINRLLENRDYKAITFLIKDNNISKQNIINFILDLEIDQFKYFIIDFETYRHEYLSCILKKVIYEFIPTLGYREEYNLVTYKSKILEVIRCVVLKIKYILTVFRNLQHNNIDELRNVLYRSVYNLCLRENSNVRDVYEMIYTEIDKALRYY